MRYETIQHDILTIQDLRTEKSHEQLIEKHNKQRLE